MNKNVKPINATFSYAAKVALIAGVYVVCAKIGFFAAFMHDSVSAVWPPAGVALSVVLLSKYRLWPAVSLGAFLANAMTPVPLWVALAIATGNTLEAVVGAYLIRRFADFDAGLQRVRIVLALVLGAALGSSIISATIGVSALCVSGSAAWENFGDLWRVWWLGDAIGDLTVAPLIVTWTARASKPMSAGMMSEAALVCVMTATVALPIFFGWFDISRARLIWGYAVFPFIIFAAMRHGQRITAVALFLVAFIAIIGTSLGHGPFVQPALKDSLLHLQVFIAVMGVTGLLLADTVAERREDHEELLQNRDRLAHFANHDVLTGLPNRNLLRDRLNQAIGYAQRYKRMVTVVFVDLDKFKVVNDKFGHDTGDELLNVVAKRLALCVRHTDTVSRLGGDEFLIVLFDQPTPTDPVTPVLQRIQENVAQGAEIGGHVLKVTCSMGYSTYPGDGKDADALIRNADAAMYHAKELGRNNFQAYRVEIASSVH